MQAAFSSASSSPSRPSLRLLVHGGGASIAPSVSTAPVPDRVPPQPAGRSAPGPLLRGWLAGTLASVASALALAWHGRWQLGSSAALLNAPSHWLHGDVALRSNRYSLRYTLPGLLIHHGSSLFWAFLFEGGRELMRGAQRGMTRGRPATAVRPAARATSSPARTPDSDHDPTRRSAGPLAAVPAVVAEAAALTAVAWLVDTRLVPPRLRPGFERRASRRGMALIYGAFGAGLALAAVLSRGSAAPTGGAR